MTTREYKDFGTNEYSSHKLRLLRDVTVLDVRDINTSELLGHLPFKGGARFKVADGTLLDYEQLAKVDVNAGTVHVRMFVGVTPALLAKVRTMDGWEDRTDGACVWMKYRTCGLEVENIPPRNEELDPQ